MNRRSLLPPSWRSELETRLGSSEASRLLMEAEVRCRALLGSHPMHPSKVVRSEVEKNVLPALALYQTLLAERNGEKAAALADMEPLFRAWTKAMYGSMMAAFNRLPQAFWFFRLGMVQRMRSYPPEAWGTVWIENSPRRVAVNNHACFYLEVLSAHEAAELTPLFCQIDHWMAEMLPPSIRFQRSQTLAEGAPYCDFRYEKTG